MDQNLSSLQRAEASILDLRLKLEQSAVRESTLREELDAAQERISRLLRFGSSPI